MKVYLSERMKVYESASKYIKVHQSASKGIIYTQKKSEETVLELSLRAFSYLGKKRGLAY
jgi:hypothetical protein